MNPRPLYDERLRRYLTALRNEKPDKIPIRPFVAEFTARYAGMTCQQVAHDYNLAFEAAVKCARDFDWDAVVANMVYVWTGLAQAAGLRYYGIPGIGIPHTTGFWMHRGCVPLITPGQFHSNYWPTLKPCVEEFWRHGHQTMFYAEGRWDRHLDDFAALPERSILFHVDQGDIFLAHKTGTTSRRWATLTSGNCS